MTAIVDLIYWRESSFFQGRLEIFPALAEKHGLKGLSRNRKLADQEVAKESSKQCESKMELPWQKSSSNVALIITRPSNECKSLIDVPILRQYLGKKFFCGGDEKWI